MKWAKCAGIVASSWALDLDNARTERSKHAARKWCREDSAEINDRHAREWKSLRFTHAIRA
jgi:hypothetical protein